MRSLTKTKILFIVEGESGEKKFYKQLEKITCGNKTNFDFFVFKTNIYQLYSELELLNFDANIINVLRTSPRHQNIEKEILDNKFAYKYLVFDLDFQDTKYDCKIDVLFRMIQYFSDETENGKLYVNYPMLESYRDMKFIGDEHYYQTTIDICDLSKYKSIVDSRGNTIDINDYTWHDFLGLLRMNIKKSNYLIKKVIEKESYNNYLINLTQTNIFIEQIKFIESEDFISVLNCGIFFLLDYFGEKLFYKL